MKRANPSLDLVRRGSAEKVDELEWLRRPPALVAGWKEDRVSLCRGRRRRRSLYAKPIQTGVIDQEIRNQRIAVVDMASGKMSMESPINLHIYDFDWSPDSMAFVTTGAPVRETITGG